MAGCISGKKINSQDSRRSRWTSVVDSASIGVNRRARRAKSDRLDVQPNLIHDLRILRYKRLTGGRNRGDSEAHVLLLPVAGDAACAIGIRNNRVDGRLDAQEEEDDEAAADAHREPQHVDGIGGRMTREPPQGNRAIFSAPTRHRQS